MAAPRWVAVALLTVTFCALYLVSVRTALGQRLDIVVFSEAQAWNPTLEPLVGGPRQGIPVVLGAAFGVLVVHALARRAWGRAVRAVAVVVLVTVLAWVLKRVLDRPYLMDAGYLENTFPSGHVAVSAALVLAVLSLWPVAPPRTLLVVAALVILAACLVNIVGHAHRPSDTLGAVVLAGAVQLALTSTRPLAVRPDEVALR